MTLETREIVRKYAALTPNIICKVCYFNANSNFQADSCLPSYSSSYKGSKPTPALSMDGALNASAGLGAIETNIDTDFKHIFQLPQVSKNLS